MAQSYKEWLNSLGTREKKRYITYGDAKRFDSFLKDSNEFLKKQSEIAKNTGYKDSKTNKSAYDEERKKIEAERAWANDFLNANKDLYSTDQFNTLSSYLNYYSSSANNIGSAYDVFSKFETEADYNAAVERNKYASATEDELKALIDEKNNQLKGLKVQSKTSQNMQGSQFGPTGSASGDYYQRSTEADKINRDLDVINAYYNQKVSARVAEERAKEANAITNAALSSNDFLALSAFDPNYSNDGIHVDNLYYMIAGKEPPVPAYAKYGATQSTYLTNRDADYNIFNALTADEKKAYLYYANAEKQGLLPAGTLAKYKETINAKKRGAEKRKEYDAQLAKEYPVLSSLTSVAVSPATALTGVIDITTGLTGNEIDPYDQLHRWGDFSETVRSTVSQEMGAVGRTFYNAAMSLADMALAGALTGGSELGVSALLGMNAAGSTIANAKKRGVSDAQAVASGIAAGVAEYLFEKLSIGGLLKVAKQGRAGANVIFDLLKQMGVEGSEEVFTDLANAITDSVINGNLSEANISMQEYMANGLSYEQARTAVAEDFGKQLVETFATGAVSGGLGGGLATTSNALSNRYEGNLQRKAGNEAKILELGESFSPDSATGIRMQDYAKKAKNGNTPSASYLGAISRAMKQDNATNLKSSRSTVIKNKITEMLDEKGIEANETNISAVMGDLFGTKLTKKEQKALENEDLEAVAKTLKESDEIWRGFRADEAVQADMDIADELYKLDSKVAETAMAEAQTNREKKSAKENVSKNVDESGYNLDRAVVKNDGTVFFDENGEEVSPDTATMTQETAEAIAYAEPMSRMKKEAFFNFLRGNKTNRPMDVKHSAFTLAYDNGLYGRGLDFSEQQTHGMLTEEELASVYSAGQKAAQETRIKEEAEAKEIKKRLGINENTKRGTFDDTAVRYAEMSYKDPRRVVIGLARILAETTGRNVVLFDSTRRDRTTGMENGRYERSTNTIYIDVNANMAEMHDVMKANMMVTISHELVHAFVVENPAEYKVLEDLIFQALEKDTGKSRSDLISAEVERIERTDKKRLKGLSSTEKARIAAEEIVARACEDRLSNSKMMEQFIQEMDKADSTLKEKFKNALDKAIEWIKDALNYVLGLKSTSDEAKRIAKAQKEALEAIQAQYDKLLSRSEQIVEAPSATDAATVQNVSVAVDAESKSAVPMQSERTWNESQYVVERNKAAKILSEALGISQAKAKRYIDDVNSVARMIADDRARLDYEASDFGSAFVSNVEYGGSFDFTTLCPKRRLYTGTFQEIQKRMRNDALTADEILDIRNMMIELGLEATCGLCYVEGSRADMGKFSKEFIRLYKRDFPDAWIPDMVDVNTPDGVEQMRINHPEAYEQYEYFWNHYGKLKESDPALFASQQKPKLYEARKEYKNEILLYFGRDGAVFKKNQNGGIRIQSFSDFELVHMIDTMQIIMDMATVGLAGQAYTKVPAFADAFGRTGLKINLSLIAKGVDENGKIIFDDREGMPIADAMRLRDKYSKNVGTILVVFTDDQLTAAMADDRVDYIIPFHRSQWKKRQYGKMGLPKGTKDYTYQQNEKYIKKTYHEYRGRMVLDKAKNYMPNEYWDFSKSGKENAEAYLKMCAENNKRPKFYKLLENNGDGSYSLKKDGSTDGYWKLLIDFKMYDNNGVGSPQMPVTPDFSMAEISQSLEEYKGGHSSYPVAWDVVDKFMESREDQGTATDRGVMKMDRGYSRLGANAVMTTERINYLIEDSGAGKRVDYANSWITSISPTDFINITTSFEIQDRDKFDKFPSEWNDDATMDTYDYMGELKKNMRQTPYLAIDINTGEVVGHEGRHRMRALEREGIKSAEIRVEFRDEDGRMVKYSPDGKRLEIKDAINLINQFGTNQTATVTNVIPLNEDYRSEIFANYGESVARQGDVMYSRREYWSPDMNQSEKRYIRSVAKNQANKTDNYLDSITKWLYYEKNGNSYFALYSTDDTVPEPTILYACKGEKAQFEKIYSVEWFKEMQNGKTIVDGATKNLGAILRRARDSYSAWVRDRDSSVGRESNDGNAEVYNRYRRRKPSNALRNCLENIAEIQSRGESTRLNADGTTMLQSRDSDGNALSEGQIEYFADSVVRDSLGRLLVLYHGTMSGGFTVFGKSKDYGYFFTDSIMTANSYSGSFEEFDAKKIKTWDDAKEYARKSGFLLYYSQAKSAYMLDDYSGKITYWKESDLEELARTLEKRGRKPSKATNYKTYLNLTNPLIVNGNGSNLDNVVNHDEAGNPIGEGMRTKQWVKKAIDEGYDGVIFKDIYDTGKFGGERKGNVYVALKPEQIKSVNNLNPTTDPDIRYQERTPYQSARDILMSYADEAATVKEKSGFLGEYVKRVEQLDRKWAYLNDAEQALAMAMDERDTEKANRLEAKVKRLDGEIKRLSSDLRAMEDSDKLKAIVRREKEATRTAAKAEAREEIHDYRTELARKSALERIEAKVKLIGKRLEKNNREYHVPDALKEVLTEFITSLDFTTMHQYATGKRSKKVLNMYAMFDNVKAALEKYSAFEAKDNEKEEEAQRRTLTVTKDIFDKIDDLKKTVKGYMEEEGTTLLDAMPIEKVQDLDTVMTGIVRALNGIDKAFADQGKKTIYEEGEETAKYLQSVGKKDKTSKIGAFLGWSNATPYTAFKRFGDAAMRIYNNILDGYGQFAFRSKQIIDFSEKTWEAKESKEWSNDAIKVKIGTVDGESFEGEMTMAQIMYLYLVDGREQGRKHLDVNGFSIPKTETKGKKKIVQGRVTGIKTTPEEREAFFNKHLPEGSRQRDVADAIRKYMTETCAEWGNEITMRLYGYRAFTDEAYVPLIVDPSQLTSASESVETGLYRILNMGFTKSLNDKVDTSVYATNLFDVFANHAADMAKYSTLGMPVLDAVRWLNWREVVEDENGNLSRSGKSMKNVMEEAYGEEAYQYVRKWLNDLNGSAKQESNDISKALSKLVRGYKRAVVAGSSKVALLQPMSYYKASTVISNSSLTKALNLLSEDDKAISYANKAIEYSGMAAWKSLGYYDVNISRSLSDQIKRDQGAMEKTAEIAMRGAAWFDKITIGRLFKACVLEVRKNTDTSGMSMEEVYERAGKLLDQVIVRTQVVDSTMTRSQLMRSKEHLAKIYTAFMSEPTMAINMVMDGLFDIVRAHRQGMTWKQARQTYGKNFKRAIIAYIVVGSITSILESFFDAWRDDDEDEEGFWEDFANALPKNLFLDNLNPLSMIPVVSQAFDLIIKKIMYPYSSDQSMEMQAINTAIESVSRMLKVFDGNTTFKEIRDAIAELMKAAGYFTGIPFYNLAREIENLWNNSIGSWEPDLNTKNKDKI